MFRRRHLRDQAKRRVVYEGPFGRDPKTGKQLPVKIASFNGVPEIDVWIPTEELLRTIYRAVLDQTHPQSRRNGLEPILVFYDSTVSSPKAEHRAYFIELGNGVVAGPYTLIGLRGVVNMRIGEGIANTNLTLYVVYTTCQRLDNMKKSEYSYVEEIPYDWDTDIEPF